MVTSNIDSKGRFTTEHTPWNTGLPKEKQPSFGKHHTEETKKIISIKASIALKGKPSWNKGLKGWTNKGSFKKNHIVPKNIRKKISESNTGKKRSKTTRKKMSLANKGKNNPMYDVHICGKNHHFYGKHHNKETRKKISKAKKGISFDELFGIEKSKELKRKMSDSQKRAYAEGRTKSWNKGLTKETDKRIKKASESLKGKPTWNKGKNHSNKTKRKISSTLKKVWENDEYKEKMIQVGKKKWEDKNYRREQIRKQRRGMTIKPNKPEKILIKLFEENKIPFKYVGDGSVILYGLCPDFINSNGEKKIIEFFGDYWHNNSRNKWHQTEFGRKAVYSQLGYDTLIIWEHEMNDLKKVLNKIKNFGDLK